MATTQHPTGSSAPSTWNIDPAHTSVEFSAKHMMITTVRGSFGDVKGSIEIDARHPDRSRVEVEIAAASIDTRAEQRDQHLKSADFLDVEHFGTIAFRSTKVEGAHAREGDRFKVMGDLTIRGTTLPVTLDCTFEGRGKDPWGGERAAFAATTAIDRREWKLMWNQTLEAGGILVSNEIRISIEVQAVLQGAQG
jgi:polyisoprenoid-binding protein YceI